MKHKIAIIGSFGFGSELRDGQTVKTLELAKFLDKEYGETSVMKVDTYRWKRRPLNLFMRILKALRSSDKVVLMPARRSVKIIPMLALAVRGRNVKLIYDVIGGWLPEFLDDRRVLATALKRLDAIWVETAMMKSKLEASGFRNVSVVPNFKNIAILSEADMRTWNARITFPISFVTFSRVIREKGIEDAIWAVEQYNSLKSEALPAATLKIYGQIGSEYKERFAEVMASAASEIEYCGVISPELSVEVLRDAYMLLFPTYYRGEGFPGTLIDAFSSGLPVIASDWRYNSEIVAHGKTGFLYPAKDNDALLECIIRAAADPVAVTGMKRNCLEEARKYAAPAIAAKILSLLEKM